MQNKSKTWVWVVVIIIIVLGIWWFMNKSSTGTEPYGQANNPAPQTNGSSVSASDTSDAALASDTSTIDGQIGGLNTDSQTTAPGTDNQ